MRVEWEQQDNTDEECPEDSDCSDGSGPSPEVEWSWFECFVASSDAQEYCNSIGCVKAYNGCSI